jgi:hypothetical protein
MEKKTTKKQPKVKRLTIEELTDAVILNGRCIKEIQKRFLELAGRCNYNSGVIDRAIQDQKELQQSYMG